MAVRRVPEDFPDLRSAVDASAPGDRVAFGPDPFPADAAVTVGGLAIDHAASVFDRDVFTYSLGVRPLSSPGPTLFRATGDDLDTPIVGGAASGHLHGQGGGDVLVGGAGAQWIEGGAGYAPHHVDEAIVAVGEESRDRIARFLGDQVIEDPAQGGDAVWAGVGITLPGHFEGRGLDGACVAVHFELPAGVETLFLDGAATWGRGNGSDKRTVGGDLDDRRAGRAGGDTLTGGGGDDTFRLLATAPFRATVTDLWPGAGRDDDQRAVSRAPFPSRERAFAALRQEGPDVWMVREDRPTVVLWNTRLADRAPDDLLAV
jgi:Ca2+-binding RTX toxin-like protein